MEDDTIGELNHRRNWNIRICIGLIAIVIVSLVGPFSTYERFSVAERFLYWGLIIAGSFFPAHFVRAKVREIASGSELRRDIMAALAVGFVLAPLIWLVNVRLLTDSLAHWKHFVEHLVIVWLICFMPVLVRQYYRSTTIPTPKVIDDPAATPAPSETSVEPEPQQKNHALSQFVDPALKGPIMRVSAADHQTRIFTDKGETRVRMRFADALSKLDEQAGMRVHRSHWLAFVGIERLVQNGRRYSAQLLCGSMVPVSSSNVPALMAAGIELAADQR